MSEMISLKIGLRFATSLNMAEELPQESCVIMCRNTISFKMGTFSNHQHTKSDPGSRHSLGPFVGGGAPSVASRFSKIFMSHVTLIHMSNVISKRS